MLPKSSCLRVVATVSGLLIVVSIVGALLDDVRLVVTGLSLLVGTQLVLSLVLHRLQQAELRRLQYEQRSTTTRIEAVASSVSEAVATARAVADRLEEVDRSAHYAIGGVRAAIDREVDTMARAYAQLVQESSRAAHTLEVVERSVSDQRDVLDGIWSTGTHTWDLQTLHADVLNDQQAMDQLISRFRPSAPLPAVAGWAMNPSGLLWLTDHIERERPSVVVECGSGTSTLWMCMALRRNGAGKVISLEHQVEFAERTRALLHRHGVAAWADVRVAPLVPVETPRGTYSWYDVDPASFDDIGLLLVDGPPAATGPHARYPALPVLGPRLRPGAAVVADDADRHDEREILEMWLADVGGLVRQGMPARSVELLRMT